MMKFYIGVTDHNWFQYLAKVQPDELNFWQPGGKQPFKAIQTNDLFLFKLHNPHNFIVGGGFFVRIRFCLFHWLGMHLGTKMEREIT